VGKPRLKEFSRNHYSYRIFPNPELFEGIFAEKVVLPKYAQSIEILRRADCLVLKEKIKLVKVLWNEIRAYIYYYFS
jgi:hypothetical protein